MDARRQTAAWEQEQTAETPARGVQTNSDKCRHRTQGAYRNVPVARKIWRAATPQARERKNSAGENSREWKARREG